MLVEKYFLRQCCPVEINKFRGYRINVKSIGPHPSAGSLSDGWFLKLNGMRESYIQGLTELVKNTTGLKRRVGFQQHFSICSRLLAGLPREMLVFMS